MSAVESADMFSEAIRKYLREKKIRTRKDVHSFLKCFGKRFSFPCELSEAIQKLPPQLREKILKELVVIKLRKKKEMGWRDAHEELENLPYCEKQGQITKVFSCPKCNTCKLTGLCVACYEKETKYHSLVGREEVYQLEEKRFVRIWGHPKLISESKEEKKKREEVLWWLSVKRSIEKLSEEYLRQKAAKKIRKRKEKGWDEVHREMRTAKKTKDYPSSV